MFSSSTGRGTPSRKPSALRWAAGSRRSEPLRVFEPAAVLGAPGARAPSLRASLRGCEVPPMRMLFPDAIAEVDPSVVYADLPLRNQRPSVRLNMIVSVDGGTSW